MISKVNKLLLIFSLFIYNCSSVFAYTFVEDDNKDKVNSDIINIYELKEQYEFFAGKQTVKNYSKSTSNQYWWPVGSIETEEINDKLFAKGEPYPTTITSKFGSQEDFRVTGHGAIDLAPGTQPGVVPVIASKAGKVIYPTDISQTQYDDNGTLDTDVSLSNTVKIEHADGTTTLYGHLAKNSITVLSGEQVEQGQVIGYIGNSGKSSGTHLHFEMRDSQGNKIDPLLYVSMENPRPMSFGTTDGFSLTTTTLSKEEFVAKMNDYATRSGKVGFKNNFANHAEEIYDTSVSAGVNPELVVVTAGTEHGWDLGDCAYTHNYWGLGVYNGKSCSSGERYSSLSEGIKGYASYISSYTEGGSHAAMITQRYNERLNAGCDSSGYGLPGTLIGMQSVYSWVGNYRLNPGSAGSGGCHALNIMYGDNYCNTVPTCKNQPCSEESKTTVCEQSDYTAWQVKQKIEFRYNIFGL